MNDEKVWLIDPGDVLDVMRPNKKQPAPAKARRATPPSGPPRPVPPRVKPLTAVTAPTGPLPRRKTPSSAPPARLQFASLTALTYLLGPISILLTPRGRGGRGTVILAGMSVGVGALLLASGFGTVVRSDSPSSAWLWLFLVGFAIVGTFTAWARAVKLIGAEGIPSPSKLPRWMRRGWMISALGLVAPGSGQLLSGRPGRAALILWLGWPIVFSAVVLVNGMGLWRHHQTTGWLDGSGVVLERILMIAAGVVALGFLGHVAQALQGIREVLVGSQFHARIKGDFYAAGVLVFAVALVVVASPVEMARQLDLSGDILREEGFRAIPLRLTLAASHLDPARTEYSLQAMELYTELGDLERAATIRAGMHANLVGYMALIQREAAGEFSLAHGRPGAGRGNDAAPTNAGFPRSSRDPATDLPADGGAVQPVGSGLNATYYLGAMLAGERTPGDNAGTGR
jgi:TM2 domain-containing membrane protein YozV